MGSKRNAEGSQKIKTLAQVISGKVPQEFIIPTRRYIREGPAKWAGNFSAVLFLFSDNLLVTKAGRGGSYDSKVLLELAGAKVSKLDDSKKYVNAFQVEAISTTKGNHEYIFACESEIERDSWIKAIYQAS